MVPVKASMVVPVMVEASIVAGASVLLEKGVLALVSVVASASVLVEAFDSVDVGSMETKQVVNL